MADRLKTQDHVFNAKTGKYRDQNKKDRLN